MDGGLTGVMIGTQPFGDSGVLDGPALDPFWSVASAREAVVFIHPMYGCGDIRLDDYDMINAVAAADRPEDDALEIAPALEGDILDLRTYGEEAFGVYDVGFFS